MDEMMAAVGAEIAMHMGAPSAIVTCGCEAAIALATIACRVGMDPEKSQTMPYLKEHSQVIIPKYARNVYDFGVRMSGAEIIDVETEDELRAKLSDQTAMIYIMSGPRAFEEPLSIKTICAIAKQRNVPVFVDAAAEEPIVPNIHLAAGATFVGYSGGKCMRGPQAAGVLLGPKDLCEAAFWNAAPHHNWGRALKVGKEEAMGMLAAVRQWYKRDHEAEQKTWLEWDNYIADAVKDIPSVTTQVNMPDADLSNRAPTLTIRWDATKVGITGTELTEKLDQGTPRILTVAGQGRRPDMMASSIGIMPYMMQPGDYKIVAEALSKYMRNPGHFENPPVYTGPTAQLAGTWNVTIQYIRGVGKQQFVLQQNDTSLTGEHTGRDLQGATPRQGRSGPRDADERDVRARTTESTLHLHGRALGRHALRKREARRVWRRDVHCCQSLEKPGGSPLLQRRGKSRPSINRALAPVGSRGGFTGNESWVPHSSPVLA